MDQRLRHLHLQKILNPYFFLCRRSIQLEVSYFNLVLYYLKGKITLSLQSSDYERISGDDCYMYAQVSLLSFTLLVLVE
jgi:hypothetical protein